MMSPIMVLHISFGALALLCGVTAMLLRKGGRWHRFAGNSFFVSMIIVTLSAVCLAIRLSEFPYIPILVLYLIVTSWVTVKRPDEVTGKFEIGAFMIVSALAISMLTLGLMTSGNTEGNDESGLLLLFGGFAALFSILDLNMIIRGGLFGRHRIVRHLWRMCFAMTGALAAFMDQDRFIPEVILEYRINAMVLLFMLAMIVLWMYRVLFTNWNKGRKILAND